MTNENSSTVLVIGGSGFIGTRLIDRLLEIGHRVTIFDRATSTTFPEISVAGDVRSADEVTAASAGHDVIVLLAAEHRDDVRPLSLYEEVNVGGARAAIAAAEANGIQRIVFTSSVAVYGLDKNNASEDMQPEPFNEYGRTKLVAEGLLTEWANAGAGRSLVIVRPSVVFGEGNRGNVYNLAKQVSSGRFLMVGKGENFKSMSYVGNVAEFLAGCLNAAPGVTLTNYADKPDLSTTELLDVLRRSMGVKVGSGIRIPLPLGIAAGHALDLVARVTGRTFPISAIRIRKFAADTTVNTDRLRATGYTPRYTLPEGLSRTIAAEFPGQSQENTPS